VRAGLDLERAFSVRADFLDVASEVALPCAPLRGVAPGPAENAGQRARAVVRAQGRELLEREGLVVEEVIAEVENGAYDLLVGGATSETRVGGWAKDDVAERILLRCPISMLIG
jgi:nucleotide-binding universal stress UspA family protein